MDLSVPQADRISVPVFGRLEGPSARLDPRVHAYRRDLAHVALAPHVGAQHYAEPQPQRVITALAPVRKAPDDMAEQVSQLLRGEPFDVLDVGPAYSWGQCGLDGYVGYVPNACLGEAMAPTHRVAVPHAQAFTTASIKARPACDLLLGAHLRVVGATGEFLELDDGSFVRQRLLALLDAPRPADWVSVAETLMHTPYGWGGRSRLGIDCSGLVQIAVQTCGIVAPRDSDQQRDQLGTPVAIDQPPQRGDLVFFPGHVGLMMDATTLLHANAHHMAVVAEPLATVIARVEAAQKEAADSPVWAIRRL